MVIDIAASVIMGALAGMGIGGGGLLVIYLTLVKNYPQIDAQAVNLIFFVFAVTASLFIHSKKRTLDIRLISIFAVTGIVGSLTGTFIAEKIPSEITRKLFGLMLCLSGIITFMRTAQSSPKNSKTEHNSDKNM